MKGSDNTENNKSPSVPTVEVIVPIHNVRVPKEIILQNTYPEHRISALFYLNYNQTWDCQAGRCNTEEDRIKNAKINYQMLQTLTNVTEEEIDLLTKKSVERITNICNSVDTMKDILGITPYNTNMTAFQKAVKIYPALLNDTYAKDVIREVKNSLLMLF